MVCLQKDGESYSYKNIPSRRICDGYYHCVDSSDEEECDYSAERGMNCTSSNAVHNGFVPQLYFCDSYSDCKYGEDEINCGFNFGIKCIINKTGKEGWIDRKHICDKESYCVNSEDEDPDHCQMRNETKLTCKEKGSHKIKAVKEINTCYYPRSYSTTTSNNDFLGCEGLLDQTNCSSTNVLQCPVQNHLNTRVRDRWLCNNWHVCDDGKDELCHTFSENCKVHKYMVCDGTIDCPIHGEDEQGCEEKFVNDVTCERYLTRDKRQLLHIPNDWICDGIEDCINGIDEKDSKFNCYKGIECPDIANKYVKKENFCDDIESCGGAETQLCIATRLSSKEFYEGMTNKYESHTTLVQESKSDEILMRQTFRFQFPCLPGIMKDDSPAMKSKCIHDTTDQIKADGSYKVTKFWWKNCSSSDGWDSQAHGLKHIFCTPYEISSKLKDIEETNCLAKKTVYKLLPQKGDKLKQYIELEDENLADKVFTCNNRKCLQESLVCNFKDDCGDGSDEEECSNSYYCRSGFPKTISKEKLCNNVFDCSDGSDECAQGCSNDKLLQSSGLRYLAMLVGVASLFMNSYTIFQGSYMFLRAKSKTLRINHFFMTLIGTGDLSLGIYLMTIASFDIYYDEEYCQLKYEWLTSNTCSFLGILSTFGSTLSVYTMVIVSLYRAIKVAGYQLPGEREVYVSVCAGIAVVAIVMLQSAIPLASTFRDYFSNGLWYKENPIFPTLADMNSHIQFVEKYKQIQNDTTKTTETWPELKNFIENLYKNDEAPRGLHQTFYGNDAVCLFKYFVKKSDPQYAFSMMMTVLNFAFFVIITLCYTYVIYKMKKDTNVKGMIKDETRESNQRNIQIKVTVITLTDLATWIPFCTLAWAYTNGAEIPKERIYQIAAVILLPINSIMNPVIYNDFPGKFVNAIQVLTSVSQVATHNSVNKSSANPEESIAAKTERKTSKSHNVKITPKERITETST